MRRRSTKVQLTILLDYEIVKRIDFLLSLHQEMKSRNAIIERILRDYLAQMDNLEREVEGVV
jgi:metal-responsive CopG/Arc/MetJ family transcriptional regulator